MFSSSFEFTEFEFTAKYCAYTIYSCTSQGIIHFEFVQVS